MSLIRNYTRKIKGLALQFHLSQVVDQLSPGTEKYEKRFKYYNQQWIQYCRDNRNRPQPPLKDAFEKYIAQCQ